MSHKWHWYVLYSSHISIFRSPLVTLRYIMCEIKTHSLKTHKSLWCGKLPDIPVNKYFLNSKMWLWQMSKVMCFWWIISWQTLCFLPVGVRWLTVSKKETQCHMRTLKLSTRRYWLNRTSYKAKLVLCVCCDGLFHSGDFYVCIEVVFDSEKCDGQLKASPEGWFIHHSTLGTVAVFVQIPLEMM